MSSLITHEDLMLVLQQSSAPQSCRLKIEVLDRQLHYIGELEGLVSGSVSISAESDIRRTANIVLSPTLVQNLKLTEDNLVWLDKDIRIFIGLYNVRAKEYKYYPLGYYVYTDTSASYDASLNQLSVHCADFMKKLDGTKNGQLGTPLISFPAYEEDPDTGEVIRRNIIRSAVIETLETLAGITHYQIGDIGAYYAMPEYNADWENYRKNNEDTWNTLPYDLEFSCGSSVLSILTAFRDLYPNYEMFFDMETNAFTLQTIPSCCEDDIFLENDFIRKVLVSENISLDLTTVRNICEVWGQVIDADFYSESTAYSDNVYRSEIEGYEEQYYNGDIIALKICADNSAGAAININGLGNVPILNEGDDSPVEAGALKADKVYSFKIKKKRASEANTDVIQAYLLGQWQVHAVNVLTDGTVSSETVTDSSGAVYNLFSEEYFKQRYHCERVDFEIIPDSPYTVQKLGEILDVKSGDEYDNITSDDLAAGRARWENWKNSRLTDQITITTALLPWLDVNKKVSYRPANCDETRQYIIKSISHDFASFTTSVTMMRFYPLYMEGGANNGEKGTHEVLSTYPHSILNSYSHSETSALPYKH